MPGYREKQIGTVSLTSFGKFWLPQIFRLEKKHFFVFVIKEFNLALWPLWLKAPFTINNRIVTISPHVERKKKIFNLNHTNMWDTFRSTYPSLPCGLTHFCFVSELLEGNLRLQHSSSPFLCRVYWFWYTLRYADVLFSSVLTLRVGEVVSVVDQFSNVSEVNILCSTQVCKCFHYNTSFFSVTYRARLLPESRLQPRSADEPSGCPTPPHTHTSSHPPARLWGRWQHKGTSHWGLGLNFVGHWAVAKAATPCHSDPARLTPTATLTLLVVSANTEVESTGVK